MFRYAKLAVLLVVCPTHDCLSVCDEPHRIRARSEVHSIVEEIVTQVSLRGQERSVIAIKRPKENRFVYEYQRRGQRSSRCAASPARDAALRETLSIWAEAAMPVEEWKDISDLPASRLVELEIQSTMQNVDAFRLLMLPRAGDHSAPVEAYLPETGDGFFVSPRLLRLLELECKR